MILLRLLTIGVQMLLAVFVLCLLVHYLTK